MSNENAYPRARPHTSPQEVRKEKGPLASRSATQAPLQGPSQKAPPSPRRSARHYLWAGVALLCLVSFALGGFLALKGTRKQEPSSEDTRNTAAQPQPQPSPKPGLIAPPPVGTRVAAGKDVPPEAEPPASPKAEESRTTEGKTPPVLAVDQLLEVLGTLTGAHLYQSYLNIGLLADAVEGEVYSPEEGKKLLETITQLMDILDSQMTRLMGETMLAEEQQALEQTRRIIRLLQTQGKELQSYWEKNDNQHAMNFHKAREEAWTGIKQLLNIQE